MKDYILIVDDSPTVRAAAEFALGEKGFSVKTAINGLDGLDKLESIHVEGNKTAMIISDINMPEMDGLTFIRVVKKSPFKEIPILVMSTESQKAKKLEGKEAGASGWLVKPFTPNQLVSVIRRFVDFDTKDAKGDKPVTTIIEERLLNIFAKEMSELLVDVEDVLKQLKSDTPDMQLVAKLFKMVHKIRIASSFIGFLKVTRFAYLVEVSVIEKIEEKKIVLTDEVINILLNSIDIIRKMIGAASKADKSIDDTVTSEIKVIRRSINKYAI